MLTLPHVHSTLLPVKDCSRGGAVALMSASDLHHKIEAFQQQMEMLRAAAVSPAPSQAVLLEALEALQASLAELHVAEEALHAAEEALRQRHDDLVAAHQQAEMVLRDSEARTHVILQTAVDGIITIDMRGTIESFNPAAESLFGYTADEVIGCNVNMLMPSPYREEHDSYLQRYLQTGEPHEIERCYALGCNVYVTKPVEYEQFAEAIRKLGLFLSIVKIPLGT
jgi:PAS domain S-box-containing protein